MDSYVQEKGTEVDTTPSLRCMKWQFI